ncbi:MAG: hypothetical protein RRY12_13350 [Cloacibacillus sp.]
MKKRSAALLLVFVLPFSIVALCVLPKTTPAVPGRDGIFAIKKGAARFYAGGSETVFLSWRKGRHQLLQGYEESYRLLPAPLARRG